MVDGPVALSVGRRLLTMTEANICSLLEICAGCFFNWNGGIFVKSDSQKQGNGAMLAAVTVIRPTSPGMSGLRTDINNAGATVWMRLDTRVCPLDIDVYYGEHCIYRTWNQETVDN